MNHVDKPTGTVFKCLLSYATHVSHWWQLRSIAYADPRLTKAFEGGGHTIEALANCVALLCGFICHEFKALSNTVDR